MLSFYRSKDLDQQLRLKIGHLEGKIDPLPYSEVITDPSKGLNFRGSRQPVALFVSAQVLAGSQPLTGVVYTQYRVPQGLQQRWNEWLDLPVEISKLPLNSCISLTIWGPSGGREYEVYGGTTIQLFDLRDNTLRQGRQKLLVHLNQRGDALGTPGVSSDTSEMDRLENIIKEHQTGKIPVIEWLDALTFRRIEQINAAKTTKSCHYLFIDFPLFDHDIAYDEVIYTLPPPSTVFSNNQLLGASVRVFEDAEELDHDGNPAKPQPLMTVYDPDFSRETPIEAKHRTLIRSAASDRDMRPNPQIRDKLTHICTFSPVHELSSDEKNLVWRYRYYLTRHKTALTKFINSVSWDEPTESAEAVEVLHMWVDIDVADALELLGPTVKNAQVRAYAVDRLRNASDHDLELYLLQLVEALKFEPWVASATRSYLARFLTNRAVLNPVLGNFFYWYVSIQASERRYGPKIYQPVLRHYLATLPHAPGGSEQLEQVKLQVSFMNKLLEAAKFVKSSKESRPKRIEQLRAYLTDPRNELIQFPRTNLPLDPTVQICGIVPQECTVFKSSMLPLKMTLKEPSGSTYSLIFKSGDDLRQDQLVIQIIQLMDQLLQKENLDLKLTPYRILATSPTDGAIQFIPNETVSHIISQYHGILPFLRQSGADDSEPLGVRADIMDTYVRSTAGYGVITYLLGVGDRHLDNLLIDSQGHFLHIDFGYILGHDPKPFPPVIKLPIQLIDGMGGINSDNYAKFRSLCFTAFTSLRKSSNLILALLSLMTESTVPTMQLEREQAVQKVEERFCLDMSEEEAILHFQNLINDSVNAFMPMVIDRLHSLAQYWRA